MLWRIFHFFRQFVTFLFGLLCGLLSFVRCKRRKSKVEEDTSSMMPTEVIIVNSNESKNTPNFTSQNNTNPEYNTTFYQNAPSQPTSDTALQDWNSWGNEDQSSQNIEENAINEPDVENTNFFEDMEPSSVKTKKVYIRKKKIETSRPISSILNVNTDSEIKLSSELSAWQDEDESEGAGWGDEENLNIDTEQITAEAKALRIQERKKRLEEQRRAKQKQKESVQHNHHKLGMKVS